MWCRVDGYGKKLGLIWGKYRQDLGSLYIMEVGGVLKGQMALDGGKGW